MSEKPFASEKSEMRTGSRKRVLLFYLVLLFGACISLVFTNVSYDGEYQLAMAYRLIKGDRLITQMWEPHQTSAFLCAILMKLYLMVTGTTTGIVLYTQVCGLLIRGAIALWLAKLIKGLAGEKPAMIVGVVYLLISPKELLTPEFGNMQVWFATTMYLCLMQHLKKQHPLWLVGAGISLCLSVFAYPSAILCYFAGCFILWNYSKSRKRDLLLFTGVCAVIGGAFVIFLLCQIGVETLLTCLECALGVEPTHTVSMGEKFLAHLINLGKIAGMLLGVCAIGLVLERLFFLLGKKRGEGKSFSSTNWLLVSWFVLMVFFLWNILSVRNRGGYAIPIALMLILGILNRKRLSVEEKRMYDSAMAVSLMNLLATLILSDNAFLQAITYMMIWICASILPLYRWFEQLSGGRQKKAFAWGFHLWLLLVIFRIAFIHIPIYGRGQICSLLSDLALIRSGPAIGIVTDEGGAARQRDSMEEWSQFVKPGDTIWILGEPVDTLGYLYEDVEVGAPTVMSTPTYNEKLQVYWEMNPEKYPDVVILASSFGVLADELARNQWLMDWLEQEYRADRVTDGYYWRYYERRRE